MLNPDILNDALTLWHYHCKTDEFSLQQNSIIIGLGSYDLRVADYCATLYFKQTGQKIIFSGKEGNWTRGRWSKTEAEIFADMALGMGVPASDIILETAALNIGQNIIYSKILIDELNITPRQIILVTKPNTTRRAYATFMRLWPDASEKLKVSAPKIEFGNLSNGQTMSGLINELVGDIERIKSYPHLGFQIEQDIPNLVFQAYQRLKQLGYTSHCLGVKYWE